MSTSSNTEEIGQRPPRIPYPGAKGRLAPFLVDMMPNSGRRYVEPFVGRGNVYFAAALKLDFFQWHINDISTAKFFRALMETEGKIRIPMRTKMEFEKQRKLYQLNNPKAILLEPYLTFSGGGYKKGDFGGKRSANAMGYASTLCRCASIMLATHPRVTELDWKNLRLDDLESDDFVFLDPPYLGADVRAYDSRFDYCEMVSILKRARFKWMLTEYEQNIYLEAFGEPCCRRVVQLACDGRGNRNRTECVWTNYKVYSDEYRQVA
jgi:site-specific DNA-adenine methylase